MSAAMGRKHDWETKDSTQLWKKIGLRRLYLPKKAVVLDLFCDQGEIYNKAYKGKVQFYLGIDNVKIHDPAICRLSKNTVFVAHNDISQFNVFDLDDYGNPWMLLYLILKKSTQAKLTIFVTDGLVLHSQVTGQVAKAVSATEHIPRRMNIPAMCRWYIDVFSTMLLDIQTRYKWTVDLAGYIYNDRKTVCYWVLKLSR